MLLSDPRADIYVPSGNESPEEALARVTHLAVGAHQDDLEIMAQSGISDCRDGLGVFGGVVVTDGAGSPRSGPYSKVSDDEMRTIRRDEQREAALLGGYAIQVQLAHPSARVKDPAENAVRRDLASIIGGCRTQVLYVHSPADKHDTHIAVLLRCLEAVRSLPPDVRPRRVLGCEVWRDLDWLPDEDKVALDSGRHPELARQLLAAFGSQIAGGKRYDLAAIGRRLANATFHTSHATDRFAGITWAIDLTPLVTSADLSLTAFIAGHIDRFRDDVVSRIARFGGT